MRFVLYILPMNALNLRQSSRADSRRSKRAEFELNDSQFHVNLHSQRYHRHLFSFQHILNGCHMCDKFLLAALLASENKMIYERLGNNRRIHMGQVFLQPRNPCRANQRSRIWWAWCHLPVTCHEARYKRKGRLSNRQHAA